MEIESLKELRTALFTLTNDMGTHNNGEPSMAGASNDFPEGLGGATYHARIIAEILGDASSDLSSAWLDTASLCDKIRTELFNILSKVHYDISNYIDESESGMRRAYQVSENVKSVIKNILDELGY